MFKKRLLAYIIDILIISFIVSFIGLIIPTNQNITNLNNELININNTFMNEEINIETYINQYSSATYNLDRELFLLNLISVVIYIIYFVVVPMYNNGQTIGKKFQKIKIVNKEEKEVGANELIIRYLFMAGIGVSILSMCLVFILKDFNYVIGISILGFLEFIVAISSIFMVLYRNDKKSLPDLIAGTKVIEVEK